MKNIDKTCKNHMNLRVHPKCCSTAWFDSTINSICSYPALSLHINTIKSQTETAYTETVTFSDYLQPQRHRLCLSTAKHLTVSITGKAFKQLLKNQRFMVFYSTTISFPSWDTLKSPDKIDSVVHTIKSKDIIALQIQNI